MEVFAKIDLRWSWTVCSERHPARDIRGVATSGQVADQLALACAEGECPREQGDPLRRRGLLDGDGDVALLPGLSAPDPGRAKGQPQATRQVHPSPGRIRIDAGFGGQQLRGHILGASRNRRPVVVWRDERPQVLLRFGGLPHVKVGGQQQDDRTNPLRGS